MGGNGSTRWGHEDTKTTVEDCLPLSLKPFKPVIRQIFQAWDGGNQRPAFKSEIEWSIRGTKTADVAFVLTTSAMGSDPAQGLRLILIYSARGESVRQSLNLTASKLATGGRRWWFVCGNCSRRVGMLYLPPGCTHFHCRKCYDLTYQRCNESGQDAALWRRLERLKIRGNKDARTKTH